ncbi:MAG: 50S ribosomal protein L29 [Candidatus Thiodiazotropha taylori]|uniref:Large ribosomal subunit protein uL29 n=3 Tax=Candidatus Thiodiazotropha TaxID=1913444 RepID=A0A1E2V075_9GAMM|nr:50S ribosomal protein L29 [Candidatus Thiodiazotropha endoloripes]MBV2122155.1 50S ribosomal protein L29 [Candidatus Thiodiazotropha taylori]MBW9256512.1 50S ribosomal protein L29 [Candidatus Thiodiazotropha sp. (ex. Lucinisca nassula)]MCG7872137.1 50S ribosomal protein L29 [Candidatus Thiodiazotropha lotti]MCG7898883.1 50S ribosomal protein L29 [Candidatus Thiodiazotropha weberae]MCG7963305.1 50S ribosomal protein L29 [Candidatus Thiodiazotropha endolucinida]MCG8018159.1 50S ribosomal pro
MKASEIREKSQQELTTTLDELLKEQFNLRMQRGTGQLARPSRMNEVRKDIARIKTVMNEQKSGDAS